MSKDDGWNKVSMSPTWDYKKKKELIGTFKTLEEEVGPNNSRLYTFDTKDGLVSVWGNTVLDVRLKHVEIGMEVKIVYLGQVESEKRKGAKYHNFDVYFKEREIIEPSKKLEEEPKKEKLQEDVNPDDLPFS